jgi:protein SCO1/2
MFRTTPLLAAAALLAAPLSASAAKDDMANMPGMSGMSAMRNPTLAELGGPFTLTDQTGRTVTDKDFRGRYALFYFGYAKCDVACPTALHTMASAIRQLGPLAKQVTPVFVDFDNSRLDPPAPRGAFEYTANPKPAASMAHDMAAMHDMDRMSDVKPMSQKEFSSFLTGVDPRLVGLVGTRKQIWDIVAAYHVRWEHEHPVTQVENGIGYRLNHTTHLYLLGPDGKMAAVFEYSDTPAQIKQGMAKIIRAHPAA